MTEVTKNVTEVAKNVCGTKNVGEVTKNVKKVTKLCEFSIFIKFLKFNNHTKNLYLTRKYLNFEANWFIFA